jgi:putative hemolysin
MLTANTHSRYLICRGGLDDLVGNVHFRDLLPGLLSGETFDLAALARPAVMVHESTFVIRFVGLLRGGSQRLAIVLDEYGVVEGVVAPADVLTAIAGDLTQYSTEEPDAVRRADGSWLVDGRMEFHRLERLLDRRDLDRGGRYRLWPDPCSGSWAGCPRSATRSVWAICVLTSSTSTADASTRC